MLHERHHRAWTAPALAAVTLAALLLTVIATAAPGYALQTTGTPPPTQTYPFDGTYTPPAQTPVFDVPPPVGMLPVDNDALVNVLVLGSDSYDRFLRRTDVMILVSINKDSGTVAMWHIPRALFVYIPNHTMDLINTAFTRGEADHEGGGFEVLRETFRYNFGVKLDYYARVNFDGFMQIVEQMKGLTVTVDCALQDWRLKDGDATLDATKPDNWERYTLGIGRYRLSPYMALWYARSRQSTSDLDRGRRQIDLLRAMWAQMKREGLFARIDELWPWVEAYVDTNMTLTDALALVPTALALDAAQIARYGGQVGTHYAVTYTPDNGREVLLPQREYLLPMIEDFLTPPTENRLGRALVSVAVTDATYWNRGYQHVAADRLTWDGFAATSLDELAGIQREATVIYDFTGQTKGSPLPDLMRILRAGPDNVVRQPDPNRAVDFRVEIGQNYTACIYGNAEEELDNTPATEYLPDAIRAANCWLRFNAEVNLRAGPGVVFDVLDSATPNDIFPVTGQNRDGTWWRVTADDQPVWVSAEITRAEADGQCDDVPVISNNLIP